MINKKHVADFWESHAKSFKHKYKSGLSNLETDPNLAEKKKILKGKFYLLTYLKTQMVHFLILVQATVNGQFFFIKCSRR
jgi:hypothetical protein